jgi:hypothetical protein
MMVPRKEINGHQQTKNPWKAKAAADGKVFIEDRERASGCSKPKASEEIVVSGVPHVCVTIV